MAILQESIEVEVPVSTAYNQWTQFETFPQFMHGIEAVQQIDDTSLHFRTDIAGVRREYNAQITEQLPDRRIAWVSTDKPRNSGIVTFESLGTKRARINVELEWEPEGLAERAASAIHADSHQVKADLKRFKEFIEGRGEETGAWRFSVDHGEVEDPPFETAASGIPSASAGPADSGKPSVSDKPSVSGKPSASGTPSNVPSPERPAGTDPFIDDDEPVDPR
jgi:hypothetical protein